MSRAALCNGSPLPSAAIPLNQTIGIYQSKLVTSEQVDSRACFSCTSPCRKTRGDNCQIDSFFNWKSVWKNDKEDSRSLKKFPLISPAWKRPLSVYMTNVNKMLDQSNVNIRDTVEHEIAVIWKAVGRHKLCCTGQTQIPVISTPTSPRMSDQQEQELSRSCESTSSVGSSLSENNKMYNKLRRQGSRSSVLATRSSRSQSISKDSHKHVMLEGTRSRPSN